MKRPQDGIGQRLAISSDQAAVKAALLSPMPEMRALYSLSLSL